ncbi:hypothetical protein IE53DRAFT_176655 [Violaceomyces palustris]|uniref:Uncharacterized protein n=1 Tax=Violaceomyces palustris TaxID=1673888 RepID=A0ACD0NSJ2_9BASI|nr:hypothetical protein IE53DRAFT_176655 [Violaceomyces palustris]
MFSILFSLFSPRLHSYLLSIRSFFDTLSRGGRRGGGKGPDLIRWLGNRPNGMAYRGEEKQAESQREPRQPRQ